MSTLMLAGSKSPCRRSSNQGFQQSPYLMCWFIHLYFCPSSVIFPLHMHEGMSHFHQLCQHKFMALRQAQRLVLMELWLCFGFLSPSVIRVVLTSLCGRCCTWLLASQDTRLHISLQLSFSCVIISTYLPLLIISLFWGHRFFIFLFIQQQQQQQQKPCVLLFFLFFHVVFHSPRLSWVTPSSVAYRVKVKCSLLLRRHGVYQSQLS